MAEKRTKVGEKLNRKYELKGSNISDDEALSGAAEAVRETNSPGGIRNPLDRRGLETMINAMGRLDRSLVKADTFFGDTEEFVSLKGAYLDFKKFLKESAEAPVRKTLSQKLQLQEDFKERMQRLELLSDTMIAKVGASAKQSNVDKKSFAQDLKDFVREQEQKLKNYQRILLKDQISLSGKKAGSPLEQPAENTPVSDGSDGKIKIDNVREDRSLNLGTLSPEKATKVALAYFSEFERLGRELRETGTASGDSSEYKSYAAAVDGAHRLIKNCFSKNENGNLTLNSPEKANGVFIGVFDTLDGLAQNYRDAHTAGKLSSSQMERLKVMNRMEMLRRTYKSGIQKPQSRQQLLCAEKLVSAALLKDCSGSNSAAAIKAKETLLDTRAYFREVRRMYESPVFDELMAGKTPENMDKMIKTKGEVLLSGVEKWLSTNNKTIPVVNGPRKPNLEQSSLNINI